MKLSNLAHGAVALAAALFLLPQQSSATLELEVVGTYRAPPPFFNLQAAEIVAHDPCSQRLFVVNSRDNKIDVLNVEDAENPTFVGSIALPTGFEPTGVIVIPGEEAIAVSADTTDELANGRVYFFNVKKASPLPTLPMSFAAVGNNPDMLTLTPDGKYILVPNEGSLLPTADPVGSISIIEVKNGLNATQLKVATLGFGNLTKTALVAKGVRIPPAAAFTAEKDLEPEYIAVDPKSQFAYVALQENNAVLKIEIKEFAKLLENPPGLFTFKDADVLPLGYQDYSKIPFDSSDRDAAASFRVQANVFGIRMPDAIVAFEDKNGAVYFATANEGDSRDLVSFKDETRVKDLTLPLDFNFPTGLNTKDDDRFGRLKVSNFDGINATGTGYNKLYSFGSRSFSIFNANGSLVFDSGSDFEYITFAANPKFFNSNHEEAKFDDRSDDKGPEPEGITIGEIDGRKYAFIGLERVGGVIVYDVTEPAESFFETYINNRNFTAATGSTEALDLGPEGLIFIDKYDSPTGEYMLVVANEVSGTTTLYNINQVGCSAASKKTRRGLVEGATETVHNTFSKGGSSSQNLRKLKPSKCARKKRTG